MYNQNFRNQAVIEVKNGSSISSVATKFQVAAGTLSTWIKNYDKKMSVMTREGSAKPVSVKKPKSNGIKLKSIKVLVDGVDVTLDRNDALKILNIFNIFDERAGEE
tara:strand:- start:301 stop:618 length:318 start_codon:yes stop_codon:yes gene_type:complete